MNIVDPMEPIDVSAFYNNSWQNTSDGPCVYNIKTWYNTVAENDCNDEINADKLSFEEDDLSVVQYVATTTVFRQMLDFWYENHNNLPKSKVGKVLAFFIASGVIADATVSMIMSSDDALLTLNVMLDCVYDEYAIVDGEVKETLFVQNGANKQAADKLKQLFDKVNESLLNDARNAKIYDCSTDAGAFYATINVISQAIDVYVSKQPNTSVDGLRGKYSGYVMTLDEATELLDMLTKLEYTDIDWSVFDK